MLEWIINGVLLSLCFIIAYYLLRRRDEDFWKKEREKALAAAAKDREEVVEKAYTLKELREYDGSDENKPILMAVNYKVYDVTKGKDFYGKGGSYEALAGHDASRALATMNLSAEALSDKWDELAGLTADDWGTLKDWERQFMMKYSCVGWLEKEAGKDFTGDGSDQPVDLNKEEDDMHTTNYEKEEHDVVVEDSQLKNEDELEADQITNDQAKTEDQDNQPDDQDNLPGDQDNTPGDQANLPGDQVNDQVEADQEQVLEQVKDPSPSPVEAKESQKGESQEAQDEVEKTQDEVKENEDQDDKQVEEDQTEDKNPAEASRQLLQGETSV